MTDLYQLSTILYRDVRAECTNGFGCHARTPRAALDPESGDDVSPSEILFSASMLATGCPALRLMPLLTPLWRRLGQGAWEQFIRKWTTAIFHELRLRSANERELQHNLIDIKIANGRIWEGSQPRPASEDRYWNVGQSVESTWRPNEAPAIAQWTQALRAGESPDWTLGYVHQVELSLRENFQSTLDNTGGA